jgi:putative endonuclease
MYYVYLIRSLKNPEKTYIGYTTDLKNRIKKHNEGGSIATSIDRPWQIEMYLAFVNQDKAIDFERYLKSQSGRAFANKRLWI